jgi:hypothetical protein
MINEAIVKGYIARLPGRPGTWKWKRDTLFRLEVRRDSNRRAKPQTDSRDVPDYITVRLPADRFAGAPFAPDSSKKIRVHGFLQSREYQETLATFLSRANGLTSQIAVSDEVAHQVTHNHVTTDLVAERLLQLDEDEPANPTRSSTSRPTRRERGRPAGKTPAPAAPAIAPSEPAPAALRGSWRDESGASLAPVRCWTRGKSRNGEKNDCKNKLCRLAQSR